MALKPDYRASPGYETFVAGLSYFAVKKALAQYLREGYPSDTVSCAKS